MRASPSAQAEPAPAEPATPSRQAAVETPSDTAVVQRTPSLLENMSPDKLGKSAWRSTVSVASAPMAAGRYVGSGLSQTFEKLGAVSGFQSAMAGLGDGSIDTSDAGLEKLFAEIDGDGSGSISNEEMFSALSKKYEKLEQSVIEQMMDAADTDNDGEISIDEFKAIMRADPSPPAPPPRQLSRQSSQVSEPATPRVVGKARQPASPERVSRQPSQQNAQAPPPQALAPWTPSLLEKMSPDKLVMHAWDGAVMPVASAPIAAGKFIGEKIGAVFGFQKLMEGPDGESLDKSDDGLETLFREMDADGSGKISHDEMFSALSEKYGRDLEQSVIVQMMAAADTDGDGEISIDEFKAIMRAEQQVAPELDSEAPPSKAPLAPSIVHFPVGSAMRPRSVPSAQGPPPPSLPPAPPPTEERRVESATSSGLGSATSSGLGSATSSAQRSGGPMAQAPSAASASTLKPREVFPTAGFPAKPQFDDDKEFL